MARRAKIVTLPDICDGWIKQLHIYKRSVTVLKS